MWNGSFKCGYNTLCSSWHLSNHLYSDHKHYPKPTLLILTTPLLPRHTLTPGRALFRLALTRSDVSVVAVNHTALSPEHLLTAIRYDSTHGQCPNSLEITIAPENHPSLLPPTPNNPSPTGLLYHGHMIHLFSQRDASKVDWKAANAEYIMESTGKMTTEEKAMVHLKSGAKKVIISAPSKDVPNVVYGVNHINGFNPRDDIISNASCTVSLSPKSSSIKNDD